MAPINDNFASAIAIDEVTPATGQTVVDATHETGEPTPFGGNETRGVWYTFTPSTSGRYRFGCDVSDTIVWTDFRHSFIAVYTGAAVNSLTQVTRFRNQNSSSGLLEGDRLAVEADLVSGTTYRIQVGWRAFTGEGANAGAFNFDIEVFQIPTVSPPANDSLASAEDLGVDPAEGDYPGTLSGATAETSFISRQPDAFVYFQTGPSGGVTRTISVTNPGATGDYRPYWELYEVTGIDPPTLKSHLTFDDFGNLNTPSEQYEATADVTFSSNTSYIIYIGCWDNNGVTEDYVLTFGPAPAPPPVNDNYVNRVVLDSKYAVTLEGTTLGATFQTSGYEPNVDPGGVNDPLGTVWYEWTAPNFANEPVDAIFEVTGSGDYYIERLTGNPFGFTVADTEFNAPLVVSVNGGDVVRVRVSSPSSSEADFTLTVNVDPGGSPPANDDWANAETLSGYTDTSAGTTVGATGEYEETNTANSVWYKYTPARTGRLILILESTNFDGVEVYAYRGTTLANLVQIEDVYLDVYGYEDYIGFSVETGYDYYFAIQGVDGNEDTFNISIEMADVDPPANDTLAGATLITTSGSITQGNAGANWDTSGPYAGDFITNATEFITTWYKIVAASAGNLVLEFIDEVVHGIGEPTGRSQIVVYKGATLTESSIALATIAEPDHPSFPFEAEVALDTGDTYWIALRSTIWSDTIQVDYELNFESEGDPFEPIGDGQFDSTTGTFVWDEEDGEYVASGTIGYGTIEPWNDGHYPYGWWTRFYLRSTSGEYLYRYGQTQQFIECFRATKEGGDYHSLVVLGHRNGTQTLAVAVNGTVVHDTDYKVWGLNKQGTTGKVRIELGRNGLSVDGRNLILETYFQDDYTDQFVSFDYGIVTYPGDGTAYVDLDPEWDMRYSEIVLHDDPEINVIGQLDPTLPEVAHIAGFTYGSLLSDGDSFNIIDAGNVPVVIASSGDYDGFSLDCSEIGTSNLFACGMQWITATNPFLSPPRDTFYPGFSFRFWVDTFPSRDLIIASISRIPAVSGAENGSYLVLGNDGTLYIKPSYDSDLIPFCYIEEGTWNYIELQADTHEREYATKIWLQDVYMGRFVATETGADTTRIPNSPPHWSGFRIGRLGDPHQMFLGLLSDITIEIQFRDIAITRHKHDRPIGPSVIIPKGIDGTGEHSFEDPDDLLPDATDIAFNNDFSGGTDGAGQPHYWTGYDRGDEAFTDHPRPAGAMYVAYLFETFPDGFVSLVTDGSGPPGHESELAMKIEVAEDGGPAAAAYVFGGANEPAIEIKYDYEYADTICAEFWLKGIAGQTVTIAATGSGGGWPGWSSHEMNGAWEKVRLFLTPSFSTDFGGIRQLSSIYLEFPDSTTGDSYLVKDWHLYLNIRDQPSLFFETNDGGTTTTVIPVGDSTSHEKIDEFPPTGNDHIYLSTTSLKNTVRSKEDDGKTHLPPEWHDDYVEYFYDQYNPDDGQKVLGAKLLLGLNGYNGINPQTETNDFTVLESGLTHVVISNGENRRYTGEYTGAGTLFGVSMPLPPAQGEWTINKWNEFLLRFGFHDTVFENSQVIIPDFSNGAVVQGVAGELLVYDRRLFPPLCARPIDLARIRFRAWMQNEID